MSAMDDELVERQRQNQKWGQQDHPDGTGQDSQPLSIEGTFVEYDDYAFDLAADFTRSTDLRAQDGTVTWKDILLEEVFETLAEKNTTRLRVELIQVAAVATQWADAIDRRGEKQ